MLPTQEQAALAFAEVEAAIRLLYQRGGQQALTELVSAMAAGMTDEQAVAQAYGKSFREFEADWRAEVAKPMKPRGRPLTQKKLVFKEDAKGKTDPGEILPVREPEMDVEGKRATRLGDIFYARRRWGAAAREYGRARTRFSQEVPQVARRYAFSQIQLGRYPEAEEALRSAAERDPEDEAVQSLYAQALLHNKKYEKAKIALDNGIAVDPFDPDLHAIYAAVARELKDDALEQREKHAYELSRGAP
jgi:predicted Zn-dependent protease